MNVNNEINGHGFHSESRFLFNRIFFLIYGNDILLKKYKAGLNEMSDQTISPKQVIIVFMLSVGLVNHVMVIPVLLEVAGRDAWVSILYTCTLR